MKDFNLGKTGYGSPCVVLSLIDVSKSNHDKFYRDCVGGIMALGGFSDELAIVGAEFMKSCKITAFLFIKPAEKVQGIRRLILRSPGR